jgi:hypothetical protein
MLVLFETAAGYALFKLLKEDKLKLKESEVRRRWRLERLESHAAAAADDSAGSGADAWLWTIARAGPLRGLRFAGQGAEGGCACDALRAGAAQAHRS